MIYVNQTIMLYTLNLYSDVCQLCLNKTGRKKKRKYLFTYCLFAQQLLQEIDGAMVQIGCSLPSSLQVGCLL